MISICQAEIDKLWRSFHGDSNIPSIDWLSVMSTVTSPEFLPAISRWFRIQAPHLHRQIGDHRPWSCDRTRWDSRNRPSYASKSGGSTPQFNPHLHLIVTDGCFSDGGTFTKGPDPEPKDLKELFRYEVLKMLKAEGKINDAVIENMLSWRHSGFNVYGGPTICPTTTKALRIWRAISSAPVFPKKV
jgi:hypothetical protein